MVPEKRFNFPPFYSFFIFFLFQFPMSIDSLINLSRIATNNDLLMDELNVIYFAQNLWLYVMIWLPRTTDNSTYFAQSLEIRGIESRLYIVTSLLIFCEDFRVWRVPTLKHIFLHSAMFFFFVDVVFSEISFYVH